MAHCAESQGEVDDALVSAKKVPLVNGEILELGCDDEREDCSKACNGDSRLVISGCHVLQATQQQPAASDAKSQELIPADVSSKGTDACKFAITYVGYQSEHQMEAIMALITKDLSEPYSIYTYRYFIHNWPQLCFLVSTCMI